jgi:hypothetical protein
VTQRAASDARQDYPMRLRQNFALMIGRFAAASRTRRLRPLQNLRMDLSSAALPPRPDFSRQQEQKGDLNA